MDCKEMPENNRPWDQDVFEPFSFSYFQIFRNIFEIQVGLIPAPSKHLKNILMKIEHLQRTYL
jgi:hypothetical protein